MTKRHSGKKKSELYVKISIQEIFAREIQDLVMGGGGGGAEVKRTLNVYFGGVSNSMAGLSDMVIRNRCKEAPDAKHATSSRNLDLLSLSKNAPDGFSICTFYTC